MADNATNDWDKTRKISASISTVVSWVNWEEGLGIEGAMKATMIACEKKVFTFFLCCSLQHLETKSPRNLQYLQKVVLIDDGDVEAQELMPK